MNEMIFTPAVNAITTKYGFEIDPATGYLTPKEARRYLAWFGWFAFAAYLIYSLLANLLIIVAQMFAPGFLYSDIFLESLSFVSIYCITLPIASLILLQLPKENPKKAKLGFTKWFAGFCICMALMLAGSYISNIFMSVADMFFGVSGTNPVQTSVESTPLWLTFITVVILAPILEEILFRGIVCKRLLPLGEGYAIFLPAAFFALFHGNFYQLFYAFTLGCFFSFIYIKTGKLRYTIAFHMAVNFLGGFISAFIMQFMDIDALSFGNINIEDIIGILPPVIALLAVQAFIYISALAGIILIFTNLKKFKIDKGTIPPPKGKRLACVFGNHGVIAAIVLFALSLGASLLLY